MDDLTRIRTFVKVVQAGSFSAAARHTSSVSSVARQVKSLEDEFGARLLQRNTRKLALTEVGRQLYERGSALLHDFEALRSELKSVHEDVKGVLRVSLRVSAGVSVIVPALPGFLEKYPGLMLDIILTDERLDLIADNIDVGIWHGPIADSELIARRLSPSQRVLCGSPGYLSKFGTPTTPHQLVDHRCLLFSARSYGDVWSFTKGSDYIDVRVSGPVRADNGMVLLSCALDNLGLIVLQRGHIGKYLEGGQLIEVLEDYTVSPHPGHAELHAVYASSRGLSKKIRAFVDFLVETFDTVNVDT